MWDNNLNPINGAYNGYGQVYNQLAVDEIKRAPPRMMPFVNVNQPARPGDRNAEPGSVLRPAPAYVDPSLRQAPGPQGALGPSDSTWTSYRYSGAGAPGPVMVAPWTLPDPSKGPQASGVGPSTTSPGWAAVWGGPGIGSGGLPTTQLQTGPTAAPGGTVDRPSTYGTPTGFGSTYGAPGTTLPRLPLAGGIPQNPTTTPGVFPAPATPRVPSLTPPWRQTRG